ncbi:alpha-glucosidase [Paenibacillus antibioticophila]|uniref:oligo-1,6-glucosidase n=1 Tax=Paenibacillus antibioticophila TaxID=1274374 RepID=A0A920CHZ4_9BACL|nr:alpha-glucosidase [Paenibacillus antibioticophila]GIO38248.1 alpha-glucosidase [Paenibacillus antibioticophila]
MERKWWKEEVVYQIYPRSFMDSNGDGIGDLQGIISKLDYLQELGIGIIWLSPVYQSPNDDNGYDISDYQSIMDDFGTMKDWEELLEEAHRRGIRLVMDLVVNHTSDEHAWFAESRCSKDHPKRDYYIWRPGRAGREPSNWVSFFSGSAWNYDEATEEYYLHLFSRKQPDLNWESEALRREIYRMMTWWLDKGIDGFRMDVINLISKDTEYPDVVSESESPYQWGGQYFMNGPRIHEFLQEMNREVLAKYDVMTVGEMPGATIEEAVKYTSRERNELNMVFQFEHMELDSGEDKWDVKPWKLRELKAVFEKWQTGLQGKGWNSLYLNNHDQPRMVSRFGHDGEFRVPSAKMLATFLHMQQGTPFIYQGEEIGMTNVRFPSIKDYQDIEIKNMYREKIEQGAEREKVMESIYVKGRDNARTPFQWDHTPHGGFTTGIPWIGVNPNYVTVNALQAQADQNSIYHYYRKLISLRKEHDIIVYGDFQMLIPDHEEIVAYTRTLDRQKLLVILNFFGGEPEWQPAWLAEQGFSRENSRLLIGNYPLDDNGPLPDSPFSLRPYEARVYLWEN